MSVQQKLKMTFSYPVTRTLEHTKENHMKKIISKCLLILLATMSIFVSAQTGDQIVSLASGESELKIYAKPYDTKVQERLAAKDAVFPMSVLEIDGDYLKVRLAGRLVWVDGANINIQKPVSYACEKNVNLKPGKVGVTQGASSGCR